jgi:uncharacterized protein
MSAVEVVTWPLRMLALGLIWFYRNCITPWTPQTCRYYPTCSSYAEQAIRSHGPIRGGWLAVRRVGRCHPWAPGGVDHVPPTRADETGAEASTPASTPASTSASTLESPAAPSTSTGA